MRDKWEYTAMNGTGLPTPADLNKMGDDGWIMVQLVVHQDQVLIYFRRKVVTQ
jgi:hypothetical protein